jgi:hypothetical protein
VVVAGRVVAAARASGQAVARVVPVQRIAEAPVSPAAPPRSPSAGGAAQGASRPRLVAAGLVLVAALGGGGILAGYLIQRTDAPVASVPSVTPSPAPAIVVVGFSPSLCGGAAPSSAPVLPQRGAARGVNGWELLPGWSYFTDGTGLHLPVPDGWSYQKIGTMYCFRDPVGDRVLSLDTGRNPAGDPVKACRTEAARLVKAGALPGYQQILIETRPLLNKAADWEYRYRDPAGTQMHALTRWFAAEGRGYALSWAAREIDWTGDLPKINMVLSTFYAGRP